MRVLVACEESQVVCSAFRALGHEAYSCDVQECSGGHPEWHIQGDVLSVIGDDWDLMIAHPPCTYLCVPGAHYLYKRPERWEQMALARAFFMRLMECPINKICVENPLPHKHAELPKYNQMIQPWQYGDPFSKRTCLWLKNLPPLQPTNVIADHGERYTRKDGSTSNPKWYACANAKKRSKTFPGIAKAMAEQWGNIKQEGK